jgi:hypothetical protein
LADLFANDVRKTNSLSKKNVRRGGTVISTKKSPAPLCRFNSALESLREVINAFKFEVKLSLLRKINISFFTICEAAYVCLRKDSLEKSLKEDFALLLARGCGKASSGSYTILCGALLRYLKQHCARMNSGDLRSACLIRSIYESKRCWQALPESLKEAAMQKHKKLLGSHEFTSSDGLYWIKRAVDCVIPPGSKYEPGPCVPTFSACLEHSKRDGGPHKAFALDDKLPLFCASLAQEWSKEQQSLVFTEALTKEENAVEYQAIAEPGKYRVITKGPGRSYTGLRPLQKYLLKRWKKQSFSTMSDDFEERLHAQMSKGEGDYISGDYDSATDGMHIDATLTCLERIIENLGIDNSLLSKFARDTLGGVEIRYPDGDVVKQTRGQLMGHPLSFPLLCIINLSVLMRVKFLTKPKTLRSEPFFINGDDILFRGDTQDVLSWRSFAGDVGLAVNEMKTYQHPKYYLINSIFSKGGVKIKYLNFALSKGHRVKSEPVRMLTAATSIWNDLRATPYGANSLCRNFLSTLEKRLPKSLKFGGKRFTPNFFLPKFLGGLGLEERKTRKKPAYISYEQRKVATYLYRNPGPSIFLERVKSLPFSCEQALKLAMRISPNMYYPKRKEIRSGPLWKRDDCDFIMDTYLQRAIMCTQFLRNTKPINEDYVFRMNLRDAMRWKECVMSERKVRTRQARRPLIYGTQL